MGQEWGTSSEHMVSWPSYKRCKVYSATFVRWTRPLAMWIAKLLSCLPAVSASPIVEERNNWGSSDSILNNSYPHIAFGQSRSNIDHYAKQSIQSLVLAVNHTNGQFLDGIPNLVGRCAFPPSFCVIRYRSRLH